MSSKKLSPLVKSKALATSFFVAALLIFIGAKLFQTDAPVWGYVIAFSEAAMVGALADWFAVTALFRHPLGLPLPHTAIIPRNKARIARNLADFICEHFLSTDQVLQKLQQWQLPRQLMRWLARKENAERISDYTALVAQHSLTALRDSRAQEFIQQTAINNLKSINFSGLLAQVLELLTADQRHQELLNHALEGFSSILQKDEIQQFIAEKLAAEVKRTVHVKSISNYVGEWGTQRIVKLIANEVQAVSEDPHHALRYSFSAHLKTFVMRLQSDPSFALKVHSIQEQIINDPVLTRYLSSLWTEALDWIERDLDNEQSVFKQKLTAGLRQVAHHILHDKAMEQLLNEKLLQLAPPLITKYRVQIAHYIADRVNAWEEDELVYQLENAIGKDLQYIRINGTLVGGIVGVIIHALGQFMG